jgi:hypothetical protein
MNLQQSLKFAVSVHSHSCSSTHCDNHQRVCLFKGKSSTFSCSFFATKNKSSRVHNHKGVRTSALQFLIVHNHKGVRTKAPQFILTHNHKGVTTSAPQFIIAHSHKGVRTSAPQFIIAHNHKRARTSAPQFIIAHNH